MVASGYIELVFVKHPFQLFSNTLSVAEKISIGVLSDLEPGLYIFEHALLIRYANDTPVGRALIPQKGRFLQHLFDVTLAGSILLLPLETCCPFVFQAGTLGSYIRCCIELLVLKDICPLKDLVVIECSFNESLGVTVLAVLDA